MTVRALFLALVLLTLPVAALAHAQLRGADPGRDAVVAEAPAAVTLTFNEQVAPLVLRWIAPDGTVTEVSAGGAGDSITVTPPAGLAEGTHLLSWRVVSEDGHPVGGTHSFHIGAPSAAPPMAHDLASGAAGAAAAARAVLTLALATALGACLVPVLVTRSPPDRALRRGGLIAVALGGVAGIVQLGAQGLDLLSLPAMALLSPAPWLAVRASPLAETVVLAGLALGFAALALLQPEAARTMRRLLALTAWALGAGSFATMGHVATVEPEVFARAAMAVHGAALLFWMGALWPLLRLVGRPDVATALTRFSTLALPMVAALVLSGAALTGLHAGSPAALAGSGWGAILMAKLGLVAVLIGLALRNRMVLMPALATSVAGAAPRLSRAIRAEMLLGVAIVILASGFRLTPAPRMSVEPDAPLYAHIHTESVMADIRLTPGRAGPVGVMLDFQTGDFAPLVPREVEIVFASAEAGIEPIRLDARQGADGLWHAGPVLLPRPGMWEVRLRVLITDFESVTLRESVEITP